ncbi:CCD81 protein, partial [Tricholaema leucomelas]|nr:CCD81 protein [Tricholaema leucomelas]
QAVQVPGLGTFAMLQEQLCRHQEDSLLRRPSFQPGTAQGGLQGMAWHSEGNPGDSHPKALNTSWLSRATSLPQKVVEGCLQETLLLFGLQLQAGHEVAFTFKDLGVLCRSRDLLCLRFYPSCVARLEPKATMGALLRT